MDYTIEYRGKIIINHRGNKDYLRIRRVNMPAIHFGLNRALDEKGNVFYRSINTNDLDNWKPG
jgi:hypothetical protein